ncbi:hypothetical protein P7C70_g9602, partial [Phenoliferia sp. Uapishka_3]
TYDSQLIGLRATGGSTAAHFDAIDAAKKKISDTKEKRKIWKASYGVPVGLGAEAAVPVKSGADEMRARLARDALAGRVPGAGGSGSGAAGPMMDVMEGLPQVGAFDETYGGASTGEDFSAFLQGAAEGQDFEGNLTVDAAAGKLSLATHKSCIPGMQIPLMPHQIIGVAWMREQEDSKAYGGILADEMGLGKTVQTIACMAHNESTDPAEKTTRAWSLRIDHFE